MSTESDIEVSTKAENNTNTAEQSNELSQLNNLIQIQELVEEEEEEAARFENDKKDKENSVQQLQANKTENIEPKKQSASSDNYHVDSVSDNKNDVSANNAEPAAQSQHSEIVSQTEAEAPMQQMQAVFGKDKMDASLANFKVLYLVAQLAGLTMIALAGVWVGSYLNGVGGRSNPALEFNWHPLFMTIGLIFLYGNSIMIYRGFRHVRKKQLKLTHAAIHMAAFILTVIALVTVFDSHNLANPPIPNLYSLHSWLGLSAVIIFAMQYVAGFAAFLVPGFKESFKIALMPLHIYFGLFGFVLAIASALMGITEKAIFNGGYSALPTSGVIGNLLGVFFVIFGGLVVYLTTEPSYKRQPIPEDVVLLTGIRE